MKLKNNILIIFFLLSYLASYSQFGVRNEAIRLVKEGDDYLRTANWVEALLSYTKAINMDVS